MTILIVPDSLKESLSSELAAACIAKGTLQVFPDADLISCPIADGGEGTVKTLVSITNGKIIYTHAKDPFMRDRESFFGVLNNDTAVVEVAAASGLELLKPEERNPLLATSYGTGELILQALDKGYRKFIIGLGGSAVNDCGAGILSALGARLWDENGQQIFPSGGEIGKVKKIDWSLLDSRVKECEFRVACDVDNPLTGEKGSSVVFGPQKGATPQMVRILDKNLARFALLLKQETGVEADRIPGAGAAGGIGAVMISVFKAKMEKGFDLIAEVCDLESKVKCSDLIITAEGRTDFQTLSGKAPFGICQLGKKYYKEVMVFCGMLGEGGEQLLAHGASGIFPIAGPEISKEESMRHAARLLEKKVEEILSRWKNNLP